MATKYGVLYKIAEPILQKRNKVTVVGTGTVGVTFMFCKLTKTHFA